MPAFGLALFCQDDWLFTIYKWLEENAHTYGFIKRYPSNKTDITGVINEPWHYRYVGKEVASEIYSQGICLEEYIDTLD